VFYLNRTRTYRNKTKAAAGESERELKLQQMSSLESRYIGVTSQNSKDLTSSDLLELEENCAKPLTKLQSKVKSTQRGKSQQIKSNLTQQVTAQKPVKTLKQ